MNSTGEVLFAFDEIKMVVKQQRMMRDADGNLVDKEGEGEGWDCYVFTPEQFKELETGIRSVSDSAMIVIKKTAEIIFWENQKVEQRYVFPKADQHQLIRLSKRKRDVQEKVLIDDSQSLRLIYRITRKAAVKAGLPHRFSPEFIFAQEFTAHCSEIKPEVHMRTPRGARYLDAAFVSGTELQKGYEVKTGNTDGSRAQQMKTAWIREQGHTVEVIRYPGCPVNLSNYTNCRVQ